MKYDCRSMMNNNLCEHLVPWRGKDIGEAEIYTCKALNTPLFPLIEKHGTILQKQLGIEPLFECPHMQMLRMQDKAPHMMGTITR